MPENTEQNASPLDLLHPSVRDDFAVYLSLKFLMLQLLESNPFLQHLVNRMGQECTPESPMSYSGWLFNQSEDVQRTFILPAIEKITLSREQDVSGS